MTSEERIARDLVRGREAASRLGPRTDHLTETIGLIERALTEQRLGVPASIELMAEDDVAVDTAGEEHHRDIVTLLSFRKEAKTWRLLIEAGEPGDPDRWTCTPLVNASREMRMRAVERLPDLIERLADYAEREDAVVEACQAKADAVLASLRSTHIRKGTP